MTTQTAKTIIFVALCLAMFVISQYYVWKVLPAIDCVRMYELEQEAGMLPDY